MGWRLPALQASASLRALPEAFPLRGRWAALAARMRCSRRRGVILYKYFANGYFVAYTSPPPTAEPLLKEKPLGWVHFSACTKRCVPPHPLRSAQHLPPSGGRLLLSCISSCLTNLTNDRTQPRLIPASNHAPWQRTAQLDARACAARPKGKNEKLPGWSLLLSRQLKFFPATGAARVTPCLYSIDFYVTHRFFGTFLVRPALLPYGKRGFRAAICKIARPQPPAAAL